MLIDSLLLLDSVRGDPKDSKCGRKSSLTTEITTLAKLQAQVPQKRVILDNFYSKITALPIVPSRFIPLQQWSGGTPDYLVGKDGGLTIKSSLSQDQKPSPVLGGAWYADLSLIHI